MIIDEEHTTNKQRRRALLLHIAGTDVQDIFATLPETGDVKDYKKAIDALNTYFVRKVDTTYARHSFRKLIQTPGETVRQFATRLRCAAKDCAYGEDTDNQIRDEILCKCTTTYINRKLLEEGQGLTLARSLEIAENCEKVDSQLAVMTVDGKGDGAMSVNRIDETKSDSRDRKQSTGATGNNREQTCYRCGRFGHFGRDPGCPAKGKTCRKCGLKDHFEF